MRQQLDKQANAIEQVLQEHGVMARVAGGSISPRLVHYHLDLPPGVRFADVTRILPHIAERTGAEAVRLAHDPDSGLPTVEIPRPDPAPVRLLPLAHAVLDAVPPCTATLGIDTQGGPLLLRVDSPEVGAVLVSGETGTGKSELLRTIALSLALHNGPDTLRLLLIDLSGAGRRGRKRSTWAGFEPVPHVVESPVRDLGEARLQLRWASRLINTRAELRDEGLPIEGPNLVVLIDGLDINAGLKGSEIEATILRIAAEGRGLGVHIICATRSAQGLARLPWGARLAGRCANSAEARAATGIIGSGAEGLLDGGDFLAILGGQVVRFQVAAATREEVGRTAETLRSVAAAQLTPQNSQLTSARWHKAASGGARRSLFGLLRTGTGN